MSGLVGIINERSSQGIRACAVAGLPSDLAGIADALGLLPAQFGATRASAIQADIDLPAGFWRVWPKKGIGLWVGREPGPGAPLQRWQPGVELDLLEMILRLGEHGVWLYEGRLHAEDGWTVPLPLKAIYERLRLRPEAFDALSGEFGDSSGRSQQAVISRAGCVEAVSPTQAVRWLSIAYGLTSD